MEPGDFVRDSIPMSFGHDEEHVIHSWFGLRAPSAWP